MAFPVFVDIGRGNSGGDVLNHVLNLPAGAAGDLLVATLVMDAFPAVQPMTWPTGWTSLDQANLNNDQARKETWYRTADGAEGATITVTTPAVEGSAHHVVRVRGQRGTPQAATSVGQSAAPDPPSLAPAWGSDDVLWIAQGYWSNGNGFLSGSQYPAGYIGGVYDRWDNPEGVGIGTARLALRAAAQDPGAFTLDQLRDWAATTIAVRGLPEGGFAGEPGGGIW